MKSFVKNLLPLGALLVATAMPVQAQAAEQQSTALNEILKSNIKFTSQSDTYLSQLICKWNGNHPGKDCDDLIFDIVNNCIKPNLPQWPEWPGQGGGSERPDVPDVPDVEEPEQPDVPDVEQPDVPDVEQPEQPDVPDVEEPEQPDVEEPEQPDLPDVEEPEQPDVPDVEQPEAPIIPERPEKPETPDTDNGGNQGSTQLGAYQQQVVDLVNKERRAAGLSELKVNAKLSQVAEVKAADMRDKNYFSHTSPTYGSPFDMMKQFGITYKSAGENIAKGQKTPQSVMNGWMNSQGHRENILSSSYTEIGVGYVTDNKGNTYWVQMFIRP